jgi:hypothetical protein
MSNTTTTGIGESPELTKSHFLPKETGPTKSPGRGEREDGSGAKTPKAR